jgi:hypothetical protein
MSDSWELICDHTYTGIPGVVVDLSPSGASNWQKLGLDDTDFLKDGATAGSGAVRFYKPGSVYVPTEKPQWRALGAVRGEVTLRRQPATTAFLIDGDTFEFHIRSGALVAWFSSYPVQYAEVMGGIVLGIDDAVAAGAGLAQIDLQPFAQGGIRGTLQTEDRTGGGPTVDWSWPTTANAGAIALEIKAAFAIVPSGPATDAETLARQFEPILFFSANQRFFPADAKRYVERCALWRAQVPFEVKDSWGGKGAPFPRAPIIDYGKISALACEPGTPLDSATLVDNQGEERFFDFKGWMDAARMPEPKVTATSKNTFSNRDVIDTVYNKADADGGDQKLRDSRFWYHAELIEADRLRRLLATVRAPDLVKVYDTLKNAALLNYYFFYPAHDKSLANCTNTEGVEFGSFAGEWGCLSLLLERADSASDYRPSFIGTSGRLLAAPSMPVAQAADDDDTAKRTVMTVNAFGKAALNDGHPRIFVAKGTHALYLAPGSFAVAYPNESHPIAAGSREIRRRRRSPRRTSPTIRSPRKACSGPRSRREAPCSGRSALPRAPFGASSNTRRRTMASMSWARGRPLTTPRRTSPEVPAPARWCNPRGSPCLTPEATCRIGLLRVASPSTDGATTLSSTAARSPGGPATSIKAAIWVAGDRESRPTPSAGAPACAFRLSGAFSSWRLPTGKRPARSERASVALPHNPEGDIIHVNLGFIRESQVEHGQAPPVGSRAILTGYVADSYLCPPCAKRAMCKPCAGPTAMYIADTPGHAAFDPARPPADVAVLSASDPMAFRFRRAVGDRGQRRRSDSLRWGDRYRPIGAALGSRRGTLCPPLLGGAVATYAHITQFPQLPERRPALYVTV